MYNIFILLPKNGNDWKEKRKKDEDTHGYEMQGMWDRGNLNKLELEL